MSYIGNPPSTLAFVTDQFSGTGSQTAFTMSVAPANASSVLVAVTGVLQDPSTYSVSGTTLTFSAAPPSGTGNISVRYLGIPASGVTTTAYRTVTAFTATAGQTTFTPPSYTAGYINVYRNGSMLTPTTDFTATNGTTVVLATGALAGDVVLTESFYVSSVLNAIPATAGAVNSTYLVDGGVTQAKLGTGVAGNGPAFSAYASATSQAYSATTATKVQLNAEDFDTASCFDSTTNYRFTPNVAGYYLITASILTSQSAGYFAVYLYKNGSNYTQLGQFGACGSDGYNEPSGSCVVYFNGSTDYVELYCNGRNAANIAGGSGNYNSTRMTGVLVRAA